MADQPRSREKHVTGGGSGVHRRGAGLGTGPVGSGSFHGGGSGSGGSNSGGTRGTGGSAKLKLVILVLVLLFGGGGGLGSMLFGGGSGAASTSTTPSSPASQITGALLSSLLGGGGVTGASSAWGPDRNTGKLDTTVAAEARDRYTTIKGDGKDQVTIMVYMCGTDLESRSGMATNDLMEMAKATLSDKVNLIVFTGGCTGWKNNIVSSDVNQIYQVKNGGLQLLEANRGTSSMTDPSNLSAFIRYCDKNFPANRNMLIFWDHGGGSLSGYGYDEKNPRSGSMTLNGIDRALQEGGVQFDFVGFDACLMATVETDLLAAKYADYMIASEETEPGIGWYYTNWLTKLATNTSMPTIEIGQNIVDDFVSECERSCRGQKTTLSVVDLAELEAIIPEDFKAFASSTRSLIEQNQYQVVSDARAHSREFATSSRIDQIDLVDFAKGLNTREGEALAKALLGAVKYNQTSSSMTNAYGISIYFPYNKTSKVEQATGTYSSIGLDDAYSDCIRAFAKAEGAGQQQTAGSYNSPVMFLLGEMLTDRATPAEGMFDPSALTWQKVDGKNAVNLTEDQWKLVHKVDLCMYYDDGSGYVDLGEDNLYSVDEQGNLIADVDGTWISINGQPVAYYHLDTLDDGDSYTITGYVPAVLNGDTPVRLILVFDNETPYGYIAGAQRYYKDGETETEARGLIELQEGDTLDFTCDYYAYNGQYKDSYFLGEQMVVTPKMEISNTYVGDSYIALYKFTDIYNQPFYTERVK
ncbi:MAG: peptidase C11 [Lachnospiraceae bacterium]|nr:peptidase C11 [Lachnospiraceae bacterium]